MKEPVWILESSVTAIHSRQIAEHGGIDGIRDKNLLDSALNKPKNQFFYSNDNFSDKENICQLAASYAYGIAKNHPFFDGNKRTAFVICRLFLKLNGFDFKPLQGSEYQSFQVEKYQTFYNLAAGLISELQLIEWLIKNTEKF
jgi:death-on-curing protein